MPNREAGETPGRYSDEPETHQLPQSPQNPYSFLELLLSDLDQLSLSVPHHQSLGPTDSVLGNRVQSTVRGQNGNLYRSRDYDSACSNLMSNQFGLGAVGSLMNQIQSGALGQNSNLYGLGGYGSTYDEYLSYSNRMSSQNGFMGRPGSGYSSSSYRANPQNGNFYGNFDDPRNFSSAYNCNQLTNLHRLMSRSGPVYNINNRVTGLNQNSLFGPEPMYVPSQAQLFNRRPIPERSQPMYYQNGPGRARQAYTGRPRRSSNGPEPEYINRPLTDFRGNIKDIAKKQDYSAFLRRKIEDGVKEDLELIFEEIKDDVAGLMMNYCGSNVVQRLFKVCGPEQIDYMLALVLRNQYQFVQICCDNHGSVAMEKLLEQLMRDDERSLVLSVLKGVVVKLMKDQNAHKVVQHCAINFPDVGVLIDEIITSDCFEIAIHKSGCCALQYCLDRATHQQMDLLMLQLGPASVLLSEHPYGNYVVQYLLGRNIPRVTGPIIHYLSGNYVYLSMNKCASNVVEKCISCASRDEAASIITEIMNSDNFLMVLRDSYGNYVVQTALRVSQENKMKEIEMKLEGRIRDSKKLLQSHPFGNRVLSKIKQF